MENLLMNNRAYLTGTVDSECTFSHESFGENFFCFKVTVPRLSDSADTIVVTASKHLIDESNITFGEKISVIGQFRSYNNYSGEGSKLVLTLFAKEMQNNVDEEFANSVELNGYICKTPVYRTTPFGREITDILLAVNRNHNKSDYIPCIVWGRNARIARDFSVGDHIALSGRMQSRQYQKKLDDETVVTKTAYEVSVNKIEKIV